MFWRIFLLIWLAMALTVVVSNIATRELMDRERLAIERQEGLREIALEAIAIREGTGEDQGRGAAWRFLKEQGRNLDLHLILIDSSDQEGEARSDALPSSIRERMGGGWHRARPAVIDIDNGYRLVAWPRLGSEGWLDPRLFQWLEMVLGFVIITLACWWVARRISKPLRHVESTARAITSGDLSLRVSPGIVGRRDEIGALAKAFNGMTEQLCDLLERQKHLLRDISHDLRTPLTRQRIAIELASENAEAEPELMASILRQNERLEAMTAQILTLYRVTEKGSDFAREPVRLVTVLNRVLQDAADYAEHRQVDCELKAGPECQQVTVLGDEGLLQRGLDNVLQNALDHTAPGQVVSITLSASAGTLRCEISDTGPGVPPEVLPKLFEPFYRADEARSGQGWGLGLAIAKDIMKAHDGHISATNGKNSGLIVSLSWPIFTGPA
ncbi:MAG: HAMP domain-containing sensor histidine kinase [Marinobacter sp.]